MNLLETPGAIELPYQDITIMYINMYNTNMCLAEAWPSFTSYGCCVCSGNCLNKALCLSVLYCGLQTL
jgi:hypothetical protein